jgi:hypothetical protein
MPYAVVNHVEFEDRETALASTTDVVLPRLRQLPGFERAFFLADEAGSSGLSVMIFERCEQADAMAARLASGQVPPPEGIRFLRQEVYAVVASG